MTVYNFVAVCDNSDKKSIVSSPEDEDNYTLNYLNSLFLCLQHNCVGS